MGNPPPAMIRSESTPILSPNKHHPADTSSDVSECSQRAEYSPNDVLSEMYCYIIENNNISPEELTIQHTTSSLEQEGILFWRDLRFRNSQDVALNLAQRKRSKFSGQINEADQKAASSLKIDYDTFLRFVCPCANLFLKAFSEELIIPDWSAFVTDMTYHFYEVESIRSGEKAQYIPILKDANPEYWGLSMCSTDGQRFSIGNALKTVSIQSASKPVTYALCLKEEGAKAVEEWIGCEPSGRPFNSQDLLPDSNKPFNASVNAGAIMAAGLFASNFPDLTWSEVVDKIRETWYELCGNDLEVGLSKETFESEKATAYNNFAISYNLKGRRGLPRDVDLHKMLDVYLGCCSIEMCVEALAVAAATLANGGVCPITGKEVFPSYVVRHVLSETMTCGMYDQSGHFAVEVGLPAKSGVSGILMVIVPNVFGFATFSPRLNSKGNSVRGLEFCKRLVKSYRVHLFEPLNSGNTGAKVDPRTNGWKNEQHHLSQMSWALSVGDSWAVRLRDIYLFALVQAAHSSSEGLSERIIALVKDNYEIVYQKPVDDALFQEVVESIKRHPSNLKILEDLVKGVQIPDSMRSIILMALADVVMINDHIDEVERSVCVRIAVLLGIDRSVAMMEINRYEHHTGHRFQDVDRRGSTLDALHMSKISAHEDTPRRGRQISLHRHILDLNEDMLERGNEAMVKRKEKLLQKQGLKQVSSAIGSQNGDQDETIFLRREVFRLKRKVDKLTRMLHDARVSRHSSFNTSNMMI